MLDERVQGRRHRHSGLNGTLNLQANGRRYRYAGQGRRLIAFSTPIANGSAYSVTVQTQPAEQTCTVTNGSGSMGDTSVTNVSEDCVAKLTTATASSMVERYP